MDFVTTTGLCLGSDAHLSFHIINFLSTYGTPNFPTKIAIGMLSGGIGAFFGTPAEVALIRMTADGRLPPEKRRNYTNVFNALGRFVSTCISIRLGANIVPGRFSYEINS